MNFLSFDSSDLIEAYTLPEVPFVMELHYFAYLYYPSHVHSFPTQFLWKMVFVAVCLSNDSHSFIWRMIAF